MGWNVTTVSRVETGRADISQVDMIHYLGACKVSLPEIKELQQLCEVAERDLGYWLSPADSLTSLVYHESTANLSVSYEPFLIPGLLQTEAYAKARVSRWPHSPGQIETGVRVRLQRQRILQQIRPIQFVFFVQEQALRLHVGSAATMHEQLLHLVLMSSLDHVTLRLVPASAGESAVFGGSFRLLEYQRHDPLIYLDFFRTGLFLEDRSRVRDYRILIPDLAAVSLDEDQSRQFVADLADQHDQRNHDQPAAIYQLE